MTNNQKLIASAAMAAATIAGCGRSDLYIGFVQIDAGAGAASSSTTTTASGGMGGAPLCVPGSMRSCYSGPAGTEGQGICRAGTQACAADGASFGACEGEVLPAIEDCATPIDEDCDGTAPPCKGNLLWAKRFGDASDQYASAVAADPAGNILLTGGFSGSIDFGGGPLPSAVDSDVFAAKLDPAGERVWSLRAGGAGYQIGYDVATDAQGNTALVGNFAGEVDFGGGPLSAVSPGDVFVVKLDANGKHLWSRRFGGPLGQVPYTVSFDPSGAIVFAGTFYGTIDFGGGLLTSAGAGDIFVAKLDPSGQHAWSKRFGDASNQVAYSVATDPAGNVVLTGVCVGATDFGAGALEGGGGGDIFVVELDSAGNHLWSRVFGDEKDQIAYAVAADEKGNVIVTGSLYGAVDFGGDMLVSAGGSDVFVLALDAGGNYGWSKRFGDEKDQIGYGVAVDSAGNALITGSFAGLTDFGGGPLTSAGGADVFVAKLDQGSGTHLWSRRAGATGTDQGVSAAIDTSGNAIVAGHFTSTVDFGTGPLTSAGGADLFIAKFTP